MKNVLLTTTALVAFAGAAMAAEVEWSYSGDATAEYDFDTSLFSGEAQVDVDFLISQELNNGAVASLFLAGAFEYSATDLEEATDFDDPSVDWVAKIATSYGSLSFGPGVGDVNNGLFSPVAGMDVFGGSDYSSDYSGETIVFGHADSWWGDAHEVRAETTLSGWSIMASADQDGDTVSANATGSMGAVDLGVFFESAFGDTQFGFTASGSAGALSYEVAYASVSTGDSSMGVGIGYAVSDTISVSASHATNDPSADETAVGIAYDGGAITASADYDIDAEVLDLEVGYVTEIQAGTTITLGLVIEDATGATPLVEYNIDVAYVMGDLSVLAGFFGDDTGTSELYAGAVYDLGGGASAYVYYSDGDEMGPEEWDAGTIAGVTITF